MPTVTQEIEVVRDRDRVEVLMHDLRLRILEAAREPASAAELARRLGAKAQKVNYHVRRLVDHGFLRKVEERAAGHVTENVFVSTAQSYVLGSEVLGPLSPGTAETDPDTAARWLSLQAQAEADLGDLFRQTAPTGRPEPIFALDAEFGFETSEQRDLFARAVRDLFMAVVGKYTSDLPAPGDDPGAGRPYRLLVGCYPTPDRLDGADHETRSARDGGAGDED